jgi:son of sevenless-like protein
MGFTLGNPPRPIPIKLVPLSELKFIDIPPVELARQICLYDMKLLAKFKPSEVVRLGWTKRDKEKTSPNILAMITRFNTVRLE